MRENAITIYSFLTDGKLINQTSPIRWEGLGVFNCVLIPPVGLDGCHRFCGKNEAYCINQATVNQEKNALQLFIYDL